MELLVSIASFDAGYLKDPLQTTGSFPRVALEMLWKQYNRHIEDLKRGIQANRMDPDTVKDLRETLTDITDRRNTLVEIITLYSMEHNKVPKTPDRLKEDRIKAKTMYAEFVKQYPRG